MGLEHLWILEPTVGPGTDPLWIPRDDWSALQMGHRCAEILTPHTLATRCL